MSQPQFDANCDLVIEMQEMGVGVDEILQYAKVLSRDEIRALIYGLEQFESEAVAAEATF